MPPLHALAFLLGVSTATVSAGGYRGRPHPPIPEEEAYFNHVPAPVTKHIPKSFDWGDVDGRHLLVPSWNQHEPVYCGSCYAHATLSMLSDRLKIAKGGAGPDVMTFLNCAAFKDYGGGCDGGDPIDVFRYMAKFGLPSESCLTYTATDHTKYEAQGLKACPAGGFCVNCMPVKDKEVCWPVKTPILYTVTAYGKVGTHGADPAANAAAMQAEILARGPIVCSIATPDAFTYGYRGGVFDDHNSSTPDDVDHDVEVVGWSDGGDDPGPDGQPRPYWRVRNSWGDYWGELGFFKIPLGVNALYIEDGDCWYGVINHDEEDAVREGKMVGTMYGIVKKKQQRQQQGPAGAAGVGAAVAAAVAVV